MAFHNSSGPFSRKRPRSVTGRESTNPALFSLPDRQDKDNLIDPILTSEDVAKGNLKNLYASTMSGFRNTSYDIGWRAERDLAEHANNHVLNNTFGTGLEGEKKLLEHQELMYDGLLAGMSFLEAHKYSLRVGPDPISQDTQSDHQSDHL